MDETIVILAVNQSEQAMLIDVISNIKLNGSLAEMEKTLPQIKTLLDKLKNPIDSSEHKKHDAVKKP